MKIQLPNDSRIDLPNHKTIEERMCVVDELLKEFDDCLLSNPLSTKNTYFLNGLSNYLVWFKEEEDIKKVDKEILSKGQMSKMNKYDQRMIPFSALSKEDTLEYGIGEVEAN